jgi:phospholipid transport system transporter-binding protein
MGRRRSSQQRSRPAAPRSVPSATARSSLIRRGSNLYLSGELGFATAAALLREVGPLLTAGDTLVVDLQGVTRTDSAGVALLLQWLEDCRKKGIRLRYRHLPEALLNIARFSNVLDLLPLEP